MEVTLNNSTLCRLCAEENSNGIFLFGNEDEESNISAIINKYLPLKVTDDGKLPRTICPGCNIQLEATMQFLNLIVRGQMVLRELVKAENEVAKTEEPLIIQILGDGAHYAEDHTITLKIEGLTQPKRKRGRPKKVRTSTPPPEENTDIPNVIDDIVLNESQETEVEGTKRRRKAPQRFKEAVQGKELERIFREEGVIEESESESDVSTKGEVMPFIKVLDKGSSDIKKEVIGHMETPEGASLGQLVIVNKGRGRPKGKSRTIRQSCNLCLLEFSSSGRYMSHIASHHSKDDLTKLKTTKVVDQDNTTNKVELNTSIRNEQNTPIDFEEVQTNENEEAKSNEIEKNPGDNTVVVEDNLGNQFPENLFREHSEENYNRNRPQSPLTIDSINISLIDKKNEDNVVNPLPPPDQTIITEKVVDVTKFKCQHCEKSFISKQSCEAHTRATHLKQRPFKCTQCEKTFAYQVALKQHMLVHFPKMSRGYACDECGKVLSHPSSVVYHKEAEHNNGRRFVCNKCNRSFKHKQLLQRHQLVHSDNRPYVCSVCNASFKTKPNLINHYPTHTGVKKFTCDICQQQFAHKASLTLHLRWHAGEKPFSCTVCGKSFSQNGNLSEHMRIHTGEKPYQCVICQRTFTTSSQHRLHLQRHTGEKPWRCIHCDKRFLNKETWRVHMRRHNGERPFSCEVCDRTFTERWSLRKHQRMHSGEKPFACDRCNRTFADYSNLTKHKKTHRDEVTCIGATDVSIDKAMTLLEDYNEDTENGHIVYVAYQTGDDEETGEPATFHIIKNDTADNNVQKNEEVYISDSVDGDESFVVNEEESMSNMIFDQVLDEDGNPLHFTMQDGTELAITSSDGGKSLQVTTEDGQTIPIQLTDKMDDDEYILSDNVQQGIQVIDKLNNKEQVSKEQYILDENLPEEESSEQMMQPVRVAGPGGQTLKLLTSIDENNLSYFIFA